MVIDIKKRLHDKKAQDVFLKDKEIRDNAKHHEWTLKFSVTDEFDDHHFSQLVENLIHRQKGIICGEVKNPEWHDIV